MKKLFIIIAAITVSISASAQKSAKQTRKDNKRAKVNAQIKAEEEGVIAYKKHFAFGVKLNTDGYGISFEKGYAKSVKKATLFQLEITERKHPKEDKQNNSNGLVSTNPFIFGKINFFYPIKLGVQKQFLLGNKSNKNGVSISANVGGGISLGLLRAYALEVNAPGGRKLVYYDSPDSALFVNSNVLAASGPGFSKGWDHLKMTPGLYVKQGVRFDYGRYNDLLSAIEVGVAAEFYSKKIPQMFNNKEKQLFFSAYFTILFGKRK